MQEIIHSSLVEENEELRRTVSQVKKENRSLLFCRDKMARGGGAYENACKYCDYMYSEDDDWNPCTPCHKCDDTFCTPCRDKQIYEDKTPVDFKYSDDCCYCAECLKNMKLPPEDNIKRAPLTEYSEGRNPSIRF